MPLTKPKVKVGAGPVKAPDTFKVATGGVQVSLTADSVYETVLEIADFLEQDGAVIASLARNTLAAIQAFVNKDFSGVITALAYAGADFKKIAADLRAIVNS